MIMPNLAMYWGRILLPPLNPPLFLLIPTWLISILKNFSYKILLWKISPISDCYSIIYNKHFASSINLRSIKPTQSLIMCNCVGWFIVSESLYSRKDLLNNLKTRLWVGLFSPLFIFYHRIDLLLPKKDLLTYHIGNC